MTDTPGPAGAATHNNAIETERDDGAVSTNTSATETASTEQSTAPEETPAEASPPADFDKETAIRNRGQRNLVDFARIIEVPGRPVSDDPDEALFQPIETTLAQHHVLLLKALQKTARKKHGRLMVLMPPGSAKSTYCSVVLPAWLMGQKNGTRVLLASYGSELARRHGRRARQIVRSKRYQQIFDTTLRKDQSAADEWALANGSEYMALGIQSGVTGNRAHGIIIDDPVKSREEADSELMRIKTRRAYEDDLMTRLAPGGFVILIQTRWHEDDLAGSILPADWAGASGPVKCRDGNTWEVLRIPARADRADDPLGRAIGDYLWPAWFDRTHWAQFEWNVRTWNALFQQQPAPETGILFPAEWLKTYDVMPPRATLQVYAASDYAATKNGGDYTVHIVVGVDPDGRILVLDFWRGQEETAVWVDVMCEMQRRWRPVLWAEEAGPIAAGVRPFLRQRMIELHAVANLRRIPPRGDKVSRTQAIRGRLQIDGLYLPFSAQSTAAVPAPAFQGIDCSNAPPALLALRHPPEMMARPNPDAGPPLPAGGLPAPALAAQARLRTEWVPAFQAELMRFPAGRYDDQVDALSLIGQVLDLMVPGTPLPGTHPIRGTRELTMEQAWELCRVKGPDPYGRI